MQIRPEYPRLDYGHQYANGLVFAGLAPARFVGSMYYHDSSLYGNNGTLTNMDPSAWEFFPEIGRFGLRFSAGTSVVALSRTLELGTEYSISMLVYPTTIAGDSRDVLTNAAASTYRITSTALQQHIAGTFNEIDSSGTLSTDSWKQIGLIRKGSGTDLDWYLNGSLTQSDTSDATDEFSVDYIGNNAGTNNDYIGIISDILICRGQNPEIMTALTDPSNVMLSGLIMPPRRVLFPVATSSPPVVTYRPMMMQVC